MEKAFCSVIAFLISLCLMGCSDSGPDIPGVSEKHRKEIESAVINRFNAMMKYSEAGELENVLMHFNPSGPGSYIDNGTQYPSLQDMIDNYRAVWKVKKQDYGTPLTKVYVLSRDFVLVTSSSTLNTVSRDGVTFQPRPWSVSTLWNFTDKQWLIHSFHQYAADPRPVEEPAASK